MRLALFGGSFDPPHCGHLGIALAAIERLALDRVLMAPVGRQPLKRDRPQSPYPDRMAMVQLACGSQPRLQPSAIDAPITTGAPNYTYDTLLQLRQSLHADDALYCLIGADSLLTLRHWHRAADALFLAQWIIAARPGVALETLTPLLPDGIRTMPAEGSGTCVRVPIQQDIGPEPRHGQLWLLPGLHYEVSATELRRALADHTAGIPQRVLDPAVAEYARAHRLYENAPIPQTSP